MAEQCITYSWDRRLQLLYVTMIDPGSLILGCANPKGGGTNPLFWPIFPDSICMKMTKKIDREGVRVLVTPLNVSMPRNGFFDVYEI